MHVCMYDCFVCMYLCMYVCMYVCVCIYVCGRHACVICHKKAGGGGRGRAQRLPSRTRSPTSLGPLLPRNRSADSLQSFPLRFQARSRPEAEPAVVPPPPKKRVPGEAEPAVEPPPPIEKDDHWPDRHWPDRLCIVCR